jgi:hypothetical protein
MSLLLWTMIGFAIGWLERGWLFPPSTTAEMIEGDDPDHNHGSRL